ncbi:hypothetical protein [Mesorhizobium ventifaucium]|uniref:hypothetical protein n=1 Tax=Mesorhizobium ventifaucium TaxID=666020 RepID=UPI0020A805F6|nr:hypothetical protein [Mesorhizobium ventifaucium]
MNALGERVVIGTAKKLKLADRIRRVELIGRHTGVQAFKERVGVATADPLKKLFEQISGHAIRPRLEDEDVDEPGSHKVLRCSSRSARSPVQSYSGHPSGDMQTEAHVDLT